MCSLVALNEAIFNVVTDFDKKLTHSLFLEHHCKKHEPRYGWNFHEKGVIPIKPQICELSDRSSGSCFLEVAPTSSFLNLDKNHNRHTIFKHSPHKIQKTTQNIMPWLIKVSIS